MKNLKRFKELVTNEAILLKKHATKEEISRLNFDTINPTHNFKCIYGQMTGSCESFRAHELMLLCCKEEVISSMTNQINGKINKGFIRYGIWSPIEIYITAKRTLSEFETSLNKAGTKRLIKFLKGETKTFKA